MRYHAEVIIMSETPNVILNRALMRLSRRSEKADPKKLVQTFVDAGPLFTLLSIPDHQIIFGRRGTGKTHAFQYVAGVAKDRLDIVSYSDLSNLGSSGGIYSNQEIPLTEEKQGGQVFILDRFSNGGHKNNWVFILDRFSALCEE
jgi:hypothetical protein